MLVLSNTNAVTAKRQALGKRREEKEEKEEKEEEKEKVSHMYIA